MKTALRSLAAFLILTMAAVSPSFAQTFASAYDALGYNWKGTILSGNSSTSGSQSIVVVGQTGASGPTLPNSANLAWSTIFFSLTPILINDGNAEYMTPTSTSIGPCPSGNLGVGSSSTCVTITGTFANTHGQSAVVSDGTGGLQTALNVAQLAGGGQVSIGQTWAGQTNPSTTVTGGPSSLTALITSLVPMPLASILDYRGSAPVYWNLTNTQAIGSYLAVPATLTSSTAFSSLTVPCTPVGSCYAAGTIHVRIAYVDVMGNEGPKSLDYSFTDTSAKAIQFTAPAASTGAVGYVIYIGLESGSAGNEYNVPLVTQPTAIGAYPAANGVCTLTTIETSLPACALTNTTYGQTGSGAVAVVYPVVTSQQGFQLGGVSTTSYYIPNSNAHNAYSYTPGAHPGVSGVVSNSQAFTVSAPLGSTVPFVLGAVQIPPQFMNFVGRKLRICGQVIDGAGGANTITAIQFRWDADGSNATTGIPVLIGGPKMTATITSAATAYTFCQSIETTVASASATGGSLQATDGFLGLAGSSAGANPFFGVNTAVAAVGSLNLADPARIDIVYVETTASTDTPQLTNLTVEVVN
jgi:hypothetical protein